MNNATAVCRDGPLALICGGGTLPLAVADAAAKRGRVLCCFRLPAPPSPQWLRAIRITGFGSGHFGAFMRLARAAGCRDVVLIGGGGAAVVVARSS